jgi:hypothetical protein
MSGQTKGGGGHLWQGVSLCKSGRQKAIVAVVHAQLLTGLQMTKISVSITSLEMTAQMRALASVCATWLRLRVGVAMGWVGGMGAYAFIVA